MKRYLATLSHPIVGHWLVSRATFTGLRLADFKGEKHILCSTHVFTNPESVNLWFFSCVFFYKVEVFDWDQTEK